MNGTWKLLTVAVAGMAVFAHGQELYISTKTVADQGITLIGWGNGRVAQSEENAFEGAQSLRVSSRNFFQGGILQYAKPIDLSGPFADKSMLLSLTLSVPGAMAVSGGGGSAGSVGGAVSGGGGRAGGGRAGAGGGRAGGQSGGGGGADSVAGGPGGSGASSSTAAQSLKKVRVVVGTSDGKHSEGYMDISTAKADARGWFATGVPLQAIAGFEKTNKMVTSIAISGDAIATYYVGNIKVISDTTPVYAEPSIRDLNLAFGDEVTFSAGGSAGATPVKFIWDFDSRDGIQNDAEGQTLTHRFRTPGEFEVTLTAVDIYGLKQPYSTKIKVVVNP